MFDFIWNVLSFIVALGILVFVHEYGHFWVARRNKVKVLRFAVGFGKPLYRWRDKFDTEWVIGAIPLGGYVRMLDARVDEVEGADKPYSFDQKTVMQRIAIVAAGPFANFIFATFVLIIMFVSGVPAVKPIVGDVNEQTVAAQAGLQSGDEIIKVAEQKVVDVETAYYALLQQVGNEQMPVTVVREGRENTVTIDIRDWKVKDGAVFDGLGFHFYRPKPTLVLAQVVKDSAAEQAGLQVGDMLVSIDSVLLNSWTQATEIFTNSADEQLRIDVMRDNQIVTLLATPENRPTQDGFSRGFLGVAPKVENWPKGYVFDHQYGIFPALLKSIEHTWLTIKLSFQMVGKLITGSIGLENLSGPISIAEGAGVSAQSGWLSFLKFLALISVNLGVINLLPLPVLDGGHLMYFFIELIRGKPVSERVQDLGFRIGAFVLMMIMGIALINDFGRL